MTGKPLKDLTVVELKTLCKERGIKGVFHKSKAKLLEMIEAASGTWELADAGSSSQSKPSKSRLAPKPEAKPSQDSSQDSQHRAQQEDFTSLTIAQLKQFCKDQGIKGFARKNKQQLLELINSTILKESSHTDTKNSLADESDQLYSEDFNANKIDPEDSAEDLSNEVSNKDLSDTDLDAVKDNFESQFEMDAEEVMVEVSDSLILEVLDRFDRIEALLQHIAKNVGNS
ncbi:MAG: hypothetical protein F4Y10_08045 [Synechococcus sp. SB0663_bin_10]|nr:hypothetical protein [Synechococcus sp. SB0663_bin_10]